MKISRFVVIAFIALISVFRVEADTTTPFTVNWPPDALGTYALSGPGLAGAPVTSTSSGTYAANANLQLRLVGRGFDVSFSCENGKFKFPFADMSGVLGIRFDPKTSTFSFTTVDLNLEVKNCDLDFTVDGLPANGLPKEGVPTGAGSSSYRLVFGPHTLSFGDRHLPFKVEANGLITFQDNLTGLTTRGSTIGVQGMPFQVQGGQIRHAKAGAGGAVSLLPGEYFFTAQKSVVPIYINNDGLLSTQDTGPFVELINVTDSTGAPIGKMMIPDGEAKYAARVQQDAADKATHDTVMASSSSAAWKQDYTLTEYMKLRDFPEEQLSYPIELPADVKPENLHLLAFTPTKVTAIPFQLAKNEAGAMTLYFRTGLARGESKTFRLVAGGDVKTVPLTAPVAPALQTGTNPQQAVLGNDLLLVTVPAGHQDFAGGKPLAQMPAPILAMSRKAQSTPAMVIGSLYGPDTLLVDSIDAKVLETGPLFTTYQIAYKIEGGKSYTATLELRANEPFVRLSEATEGLTEADTAMLRLDYGAGHLDPNRRMTGSNSGYDLYSGDYDRGVREGKLNFALGIFTPNGLGLMRSTAFYNQDGTNTLLLAIDRTRDWQTSKRALWSALGAYENMRFYSRGQEKYLTTGLSGAKTYWALGLIPRDKMVLSVLPDTKSLASGPESQLYNSLSVWSLNEYKDRMPDWPEKLDAGVIGKPDFLDFPSGKPITPMTYDEYEKKYLEAGYLDSLLNYSSDFGGNSDRAMPPYFAEYAVSRASWTPEQRAQVRQVLLWMAAYAEGDANQPHHSMMSGHPNFVMDTKQAIPFAVATFPNHPSAKIWRDSYMDFYNEWLDKYERKDVPELNTKGGRWTENIACYVGQCFSGLLPDQLLLRSYDGTVLAKNPQLPALIRWMAASMMSPNDGVRMIPPEGAHSFNFEPGHGGRRILFRLCEDLAPDEPQLSAEMKWLETNGKEGTKPDIHSGLYTDYGPVFHYDFGGEHESYAHLQNIFGMNYRWTAAGVVYYGAKNKVWSYNTAETNGDEFDINQLSAFNVNGKGLSNGPTDQLLYDFDFAQFYRQPGKEGDAYLARGVMLLRDNYLVVSDEVQDALTPGTFNWVNLNDLPQIYQLKPGAPVENKISRDPQPVHPGNPDRTAHLSSYSGKGDFLTVVAPDAVTAVATPFGAAVNGEYVFASQKPEDITQGAAVFSGSYGYARPNQLALFQGTKIGLNGFTLSRDGGDFGVSAVADTNKITGRVVGRSGGKISVVPPTGLNPASATVTFNGQSVPHTVDQGAIVFSVDIAQKDGLQNYAIEFGK